MESIEHSDKWIVPGMRMLRTYKGENALGESIEVEFTRLTNPGTARSLPRMWHKAGHTAVEFDNWWNVQVYATDRDGNCRGKYNPTEKRGGYGRVLDFDWVMTATPENLEAISQEIVKRAFAA